MPALLVAEFPEKSQQHPSCSAGPVAFSQPAAHRSAYSWKAGGLGNLSEQWCAGTSSRQLTLAHISSHQLARAPDARLLQTPLWLVNGHGKEFTCPFSWALRSSTHEGSFLRGRWLTFTSSPPFLELTSLRRQLGSPEHRPCPKTQQVLGEDRFWSQSGPWLEPVSHHPEQLTEQTSKMSCLCFQALGTRHCSRPCGKSEGGQGHGSLPPAPGGAHRHAIWEEGLEMRTD